MSSTPASSIADPAPLGLAGFALTTFVLSLANAGLLPAGADHVVVPLAAAYGGLAQFCAGMWEFKRGNTFGAVAFTSYGAFWFSFVILITASIHQIPAASIPASLGIYLIAWGIFTAIMTYAATKIGSMPVLSVFVLLTITYFVLGIGAWGGLPGISVIGGYVGILTAIAAWYASATMVYGSLPK